MPPQKRVSAKAKDSVKVEPASATQSRASAVVPSAKEVEAAIEQSAEHLEAQASPPDDIHPKPTTPSKAEVEEAVAKSAEHLETTGHIVTVESRDKTMDAAPVSAGGRDHSLDAPAVSADRDKTMDSPPVFSSPVSSTPKADKERSDGGAS